MRISFRQPHVVSLLALLLVAACTDVGSSREDPPASEVVREPAISPANRPPTVATLVVQNPMPHAMIVSLIGDGERVLGTVPAAGRQIFELSVPAGSTISLLARDEAKTHSPTTTIALAEADEFTVWVIP